MQPERILRLPEVAQRTGLKRTRIYELEKLDQFPKRRRISERACGWLESEINAFIQSRPVVA
jgi:prophage regulatory protein